MGPLPFLPAVGAVGSAAASCLPKAGADPTTEKQVQVPLRFIWRCRTPAAAVLALTQPSPHSGGSLKLFSEFGVSTKLTDGRGGSVADCATSGWVRKMLSGNTKTRAT